MKAIYRILRPALFLAGLLFHISAYAQHEGDLDLTFGFGGRIKTGFGGGVAVCYAACVQSDGKLILAGSASTKGIYQGGVFLLARYTTNGFLDTTFGYAGKVETPVSFPMFATNAAIMAVKQQSDGKLVAGGYSFGQYGETDFTLARYNTDGSLDKTFGTNGTGIVKTYLFRSAAISALTIETDGKIIAVGYLGGPYEDSYDGMAVARYETNGAPDLSFGDDGEMTVESSDHVTAAYAMQLQGNGSIIAVGSGKKAGDSGADFAMWAITTNGVLDTTFGGGTGMVFTQIEADTGDYASRATGVATQLGMASTGNPNLLVVAGIYSPSDADTEIAVARYNLNGTLDTAFGKGGIVTNQIPVNGVSSGEYCLGLIVQGGGIQPRKIILGAISESDAEIERLTATGALDTTFGTGGSTTVAVEDISANAAPLVTQNGEFVMASGEGKFVATRVTSTGILDTNFANHGTLSSDLADGPAQTKAIVTQADGKAWVVGNSSIPYSQKAYGQLGRYNQDGTLDTSFNPRALDQGGWDEFSLEGGSGVNTLAVQPDGKIVVAGQVGDSIFLFRSLTNGVNDLSFAVGGSVDNVLPSNTVATAMKIESDGKIIVAGNAGDSAIATNTDFIIARFTTNGDLDTTFGAGGTVVTSFASGSGFVTGMGIEPDGKYVVGGYMQTGGGASLSQQFALVRYNTNGTLDFSFGSLGRVTTTIAPGTLDTSSGMAIQPDGKIVAVGGAALGANSYVVLARFNTNGSLDSSFGSSGSAIAQVGTASDSANAVTLQSDGKIVIAGQTLGQFYQYFAQRYNTNGSLDTSFGTGGTTVVDFDSETNELGLAVTIDPLGRVILAGDAGGVFGIARLIGPPITTQPPLAITVMGNNLGMSWPATFSGWSVQQTSNLGTGWTAASATISSDGTNNFAQIAPPTTTTFYRLAAP